MSIPYPVCTGGPLQSLHPARKDNPQTHGSHTPQGAPGLQELHSAAHGRTRGLKNSLPRRLILSLNAVHPVRGPGWGQGTRAGGIYIFLYFQGNINRTLSPLYAIVNKYRPWRFKISCGFMKINKNEFLFFHQTQSSLKKYLTDTT